MNVIINNSSMQPIYEQIVLQIKTAIMHGELKEEVMLPSVRTLAKNLKVSALTVKKAYDALEEEGFIVTVHGKGSFVTLANQALMLEEKKKEVEADLEMAIRKGRSCGMNDEELTEFFQIVLEYEGFELNCSMEVPAGCVTGLIGKNGAGKSTTFKMILGLLYPDSGTIEMFGKPVGQLEPLDKEKIGTVLADSGFSAYLMIKDIIPVLAGMYKDFNREDFMKKCGQFDLPLDKKIKEFSTGMKRKLQVLAAISHKAELLILDEPTAGLDVVAREELLELLREYMEQEGRSILISSHIAGDLEGFCDDIYMIDDGKIILHEETDLLLSSYALLKMTKEQYQALDKKYILYRKEEPFGISCLTNQKQFYVENYPQITAEKGSIDELIMMIVRGEKL